MKTKLLILLVLLNFTSFVSAQTTSEINEQAEKSYKKADTELNSVYKQLMAILNKNEKSLLKKTQIDWIKFRDSNCEFVASEAEGGTLQSSLKIGCLDETTKARVKDLKVILKRRKI
jgi:uncharacterized protein YecT (DUF1311 family)